MPNFVIKIDVKDITDGDATNLAQDIWDENAEELNAVLDDFDITIEKDGFPFDWEPKELA